MNQHKDFNLNSEELEYLRGKNLSLRKCYLCQKFTDTKDVRQSIILCGACESKRSLIRNRANLDQEAKQRILNSETVRQGPFFKSQT